MQTSCCNQGKVKDNKFYKNKLFWLLIITFFVYVISLYIPALADFNINFKAFFAKMTFPILLGLFLGGLIEWLVPKEYISSLLSGKRKRNIINAILAGFIMSACSHGILAIAIQLYKKGASPASTVAFLLASPWANLPITILMFGFFGIKALLIVFSAMLIAFITGLIFIFLEKIGFIESNPNAIDIQEGFSIYRDSLARLKNTNISFKAFFSALKQIFLGTISLANMVLWWIVLGALISIITSSLLPVSIMQSFLGASLLGLLFTLILATILEVCSEGTAPIAFEIYRQTGAFGNAFVFLMAGVVTDYTEIGLLWQNVGKKTAIMLPLITVPMVVALGFIFNQIF